MLLRQRGKPVNREEEDEDVEHGDNGNTKEAIFLGFQLRVLCARENTHKSKEIVPSSHNCCDVVTFYFSGASFLSFQ